jgi:nucleoside-diphosphate-sugar epimerase/pimeloyl-ACP methyl ester carboxylesterase
MSILITGATGFVGSAFLARLLGSDALGDRQVFALLRAGDAAPAVRLEQALARAMHAINRSDSTPQALADRVTIVPGDLSQDMAGLDQPTLEQLATAGIQEIWHVAADLSPAGHQDNIGAAHVVANLAARLGVRSVRHVSTAYVTGAGETRCTETDTAPAPSGFNNAYEKSKRAAEQILTDAGQVHGWGLSILRPTIIVGARDSKLPAGSSSGLYGVLHLLMKQAHSRPGKAVTLFCGTGELNLVYVDRVVDAMLADHAAPCPAGETRARFIGGSNVPVATVLAALRDRLGLKITCVSDPAQIPEQDRALNRALAFFAPYTLAENRKVFDGAALEEADKIYEIDILNLIEAACNEARQGPLMDDMRMMRLQRASGGPVVAYVNRDFDPAAQTAVIVNAYGMPCTVLHPLITQLRSAGLNTVTWDCRGLPDRGFDLAQDFGVAMQDHFDDWELICAVLGLRDMHLLGWSTGAVVASYIAHQAPRRIRNLSLINGSFMHRKAMLTPFQKNLKSIMPKVAVSQSIARVLFNSVFKEDRSAMVRLVTRDIANKAEEAMSVTLPQERHLVQMLTSSPDQVFRYARLIRAFVKEDPMRWLPDITSPTALFTGTGDITAHPQGSYDAAGVIRGARLHSAGDATHLALYSDPDFISEICGFVTGASDLTPAIKKVA